LRSTLNSPPLVTLPNLTFYLNQISDDLGVLTTNRILMNKAVQFAINDSEIFLTVTDKMLQQFTPLDLNATTGIDTVTTVLTIANPIISGLALVGFAYI